MNIMKENDDLEEEIGSMNEQMDREGSLNDLRCLSLKERIDLFKEHAKIQDQMIDASKQELMMQRQRFAQAS